MKIDPKQVQETIDLLYTAFGNNFTYYLKTHNFHWTVMGKDFPQYHKMLEHIYEDAQGAIDDYAEQLRRLGVFPKGDYRDIMNGTQLSDPTDSITDPMVLFQIIDNDLDIIVSTLQDAALLAGQIGEFGLQNFLGDRIDAHRKTQWMVDAILGEPADMKGQDIEPLENENGTEEQS